MQTAGSFCFKKDSQLFYRLLTLPRFIGKVAAKSAKIRYYSLNPFVRMPADGSYFTLQS